MGNVPAIRCGRDGGRRREPSLIRFAVSPLETHKILTNWCSFTVITKHEFYVSRGNWMIDDAPSLLRQVTVQRWDPVYNYIFLLWHDNTRHDVRKKWSVFPALICQLIVQKRVSFKKMMWKSRNKSLPRTVTALYDGKK